MPEFPVTSVGSVDDNQSRVEAKLRSENNWHLTTDLVPPPAVRMVGILVTSFGGGAPKLLRGEKRGAVET
jgi:hypothetical protein